MNKPEPCPGTEDLHSMALEMGASTLAMLGGTYVVPRLWNPIKSMIGQGVKMIKSLIDQDLNRVKADLQYVKVYLKNETRKALEVGASTLAMLEANNLVPWMWNLTKSTTGQGVKKNKSVVGEGVKRIKSIIDQDVKRVKADLQYVKVYLKNETRKALEIGASTLAVLEANFAVPWLWNLTKSGIGQVVKRIKSIVDQDVKRVKADLQHVKDCWYNAWPIRGLAVFESDDEYNTIASDVVHAADRNPPEDRDPHEASGPSEDRSLPEDNAPSESTDPSEDRDLPEARGGPTEDRDSTNDAASTSQVRHNAKRRRRTILFLKKGKRCNNVFSYNTVTKKCERKSSSPKKPRVGVPGLQSKIAGFLK